GRTAAVAFVDSRRGSDPRSDPRARSRRSGHRGGPAGNARPRRRLFAPRRTGRRRRGGGQGRLMIRRLATLFRKEVLDLMRNRAALLPVAVVALLALAMPFTITILVPRFAHQPLSADPDLVRVSRQLHPDLAGDNARVQLFLYEQFLLVFLLMPITGAMSLAAHAIV